MRNRIKNEIQEHATPADNGGHQHYWVIEAAEGSTSKGVCKLCGAEKEFLNSMPELTVVKRRTNPLELPEMRDVEFDEKQRKS